MNEQSTSAKAPEPDDLAAALATLRQYAAAHGYEAVAAWFDREHAEAQEARASRDYLGTEFDAGWVAASVCMTIARQIPAEATR